MWTQKAVRTLFVGYFLALGSVILGPAYAAAQDGVVPGAAGPAAKGFASEDAPERAKIAEGEYTIKKDYGGVGPVESEVFNFHESWALWRTLAGDFHVEGTRTFESPKDVPRKIQFSLHLSPELQLVEAMEYTRLIWVRDSGPLTCTFSPKTVQCSANGREPSNTPAVSLSMDKPYAFSWPLSAFSAAALTRRTERRPGRVTQVQLVGIKQPGPNLPVMPMITSGKLLFLGRERITVAGMEWEAEKFELDAFMSSLPRQSFLWVSGTGLLLKAQGQDKFGPQGCLELTRFENREADSPASR